MSEARNEVIRAAIKLEQDGRRFFNQVANRTKNRQVAEIFLSLAEDEENHIEWLSELAVTQDDIETAHDVVYERLSWVFSEASADMLNDVALLDDEMEALNLAIELEERAQLAYRKWAEETDQPEVRAICNLIAGAEDFHRKLLKSAVRKLDRPSDPQSGETD